MNWNTVIVIVGVLGVAGVWWLGSSLSWMAKEDKELVEKHEANVLQFRANKKTRQAEIYRKGFGKNPYKEKVRLRIIQNQIDEVIREIQEKDQSQ